MITEDHPRIHGGWDILWKLICGTHNLLKLCRRALAKPDTVPFSRVAAPVAG